MFSIASKEWWDKIGRNLFPKDWKGTPGCYRTLIGLLILIALIVIWVGIAGYRYFNTGIPT